MCASVRVADRILYVHVALGTDLLIDLLALSRIVQGSNLIHNKFMVHSVLAVPPRVTYTPRT